MNQGEFDAMIDRPADDDRSVGRLPTLDEYGAALAAIKKREAFSMREPIVLKLGDPCPACGGELKAAPVPTDEQFRRAFDRENPIMLPPGMDTAKPEDRAELGALHGCGACGYKTRFKADEKPARKRGANRDDE